MFFVLKMDENLTGFFCKTNLSALNLHCQVVLEKISVQQFPKSQLAQTNISRNVCNGTKPQQPEGFRKKSKSRLKSVPTKKSKNKATKSHSNNSIDDPQIETKTEPEETVNNQFEEPSENDIVSFMTLLVS